jgi:hypothetical protein
MAPLRESCIPGRRGNRHRAVAGAPLSRNARTVRVPSILMPQQPIDRSILVT